MIGQIGTAWAALVPSRTEHEVIDQQLVATVEQIGKGFSDIGSIERVVFFDFFPRQFTTGGTECIPGAGKFFFLFEKCYARGYPVFM